MALALMELRGVRVGAMELGGVVVGGDGLALSLASSETIIPQADVTWGRLLQNLWVRSFKKRRHARCDGAQLIVVSPDIPVRDPPLLCLRDFVQYPVLVDADAVDF